MTRQRPDSDGNYPAAQHYNIRCAGDVVFNRVTARHFRYLRAESIEWVWIVEEEREATRKEIMKLCAGVPPS